MAKGKHSAALFEVINSAKRPEKVAQSLRTPKWWFKGNPTSGAAATATAPPPSFHESEPAADAPQPVTHARPGVSGSIPAGAAGRSSAVHLDFNKDRQEITFRLRYTTALVSAFMLCVAIGVAYVIGRHLDRGPQTAQASTVPPASTYQRQAPQSGVTDVTRPRVVHNASNDTPVAHRPTTEAPPAAPRVTPAVPPSLVPASAETRMPRAIGLNYAIIQTYPPEEQQAAEAARDFLNKNGIPCTLETTDYVKKPNWTCLVGTAGFAKISSGDYLVYRSNILALAEKFPSSRFNRFDPKPYKWRGD